MEQTKLLIPSSNQMKFGFLIHIHIKKQYKVLSKHIRLMRYEIYIIKIISYATTTLKSTQFHSEKYPTAFIDERKNPLIIECP